MRLLELPACFYSLPWKGGPVYTDTVTTACDLPHPASGQEHLLGKGQQSFQMNGRPEQIEQTSVCYLLSISKYIQWLPLDTIYNSQDMDATYMSTERWMDKEVMKHIYTMEYYSVMKRNKFESVLVRQMNLEPIVQSKVSQKEKLKYRIGRPGVLQFVGLQRVRHDWATELNCPECICIE